MATTMVAGFVTTPFLVRRLGDTNYGLWIVIASFTSYFGMLDLGVAGPWAARSPSTRHAAIGRASTPS